MITIKCPNCGQLAEVFATDYPCRYCMDSGNCINESMDMNICTDFDVVKCKCGFVELI